MPELEPMPNDEHMGSRLPSPDPQPSPRVQTPAPEECLESPPPPLIPLPAFPNNVFFPPRAQEGLEPEEDEEEGFEQDEERFLVRVFIISYVHLTLPTQNPFQPQPDAPEHPEPLPEPQQPRDHQREQNEHEDPRPDTLDIYLEEITIKHIRDALANINMIRDATIENSKLDDATKARLRDPPVGEVPIDDPDLFCALDLFLNSFDMNEDVYKSATQTMNERDQAKGIEPSMPTIAELNNTITHITGVVPVLDHMCVNSCIAYTGVHKDLDKCPR